MPEDTGGVPDESLFQRVCQGENDLYEVLFERYKHVVARIIIRIAGTVDETEDLVADVFLTAYRKRHQYRQSGAFKSWLYQIAANTARQYARKQRFRSRAMASFMATQGTPFLSDADRGNPGHFESKDVLAACLSGLRPKLRAAFVLRDLEGLSYEEIAEILKCPIGTVKSRINAARKMMLKRAQELLNME